MNPRDVLQRSWEELVKQLNEIRSTGQSEKNVKSWKEICNSKNQMYFSICIKWIG